MLLDRVLTTQAALQEAVSMKERLQQSFFLQTSQAAEQTQ
jgi:hypothetical protein